MANQWLVYNDSYLLEALPQMPPNLDNSTIGDIPMKYWRQTAKRFPSQGMCVDATTKQLVQMWQNVRNTKAAEHDHWWTQVSNVFTPNPESNERTMVSLSVRSVWDLYFQIRNYPKGTEVLMTAINIGDMYKVVEEHGLIPVPVDIDPYTMAPKLESIKAAVTDKTRVILFAFLFGITYDVAPYADFLDSQGIEIIEDCAQSWRGLDVFRGSPRAKMTMFSFGSIKFNAAFYGAISIVRNEAQLVDKMRSIQDTYEALSTDEYSKKIRTFLVLQALVTNQIATRMADNYFDYQHLDFEDWVVAKMRGFPAQDQFLNKFRKKPNAALLKNLHFRTAGYTGQDHNKKIQHYLYSNQVMTNNGVFVPGCAVGQNRSAWLMPITVSNKCQFREFARLNGINCYRGATQIKLVPQPKSRQSIPKPEYQGCPNALWLTTHIVYLPVNTMLPDKAVKELITLCVDISSRYNAFVEHELARRQPKVNQVVIEMTPMGRAKL